MKRAISATAILAIGLAVAGCGSSTSATSVVTRTVTAIPSATQATAPAAADSAASTAPSGMDTDTGTGNVAVAKFGDTVDLKDSQIKVTLGTPKVWDGDEYTEADPSLYAKGSKTVVHIRMTVQNYGAYNFNPNYFNISESVGNYADMVTTTADDEAPAKIPAGQTESWTLETGADAKGQLSIEIDDSSNEPLAYFSNETH